MADVDFTKIPENLRPNSLTDRQRAFVEALYESPGSSSRELAESVTERLSDDEQMGNSYPNYLAKRYPEVFEMSDHPRDGRLTAYHLTDDALSVYKAAGILKEDGVADLANEVEEPSQRHEKGGVTYEGPPLNLGYQDITERPVRSARPPGDDVETTKIEMSYKGVFELLRSTEDERVAWDIFNQVVDRG